MKRICVLVLAIIISCMQINFVYALEEFVVEDGVLIEYNGPGGDIVIPDDLGIRSIGPYSFMQNKNITSVVFQEGIRNILSNLSRYRCRKEG